MTILDRDSDAPLVGEIARLNRRLERERAARKEAELIAESATKVSIEDSLTGLANRTLLTASLENELARAARYKRDVALLYVDLDRFKLVNDTYGHEAGDAVLREVADILRITTREGDLVGRLGGDEFMVIAPDIGEPDAVRLAARIAEAIEAIQLEAVFGTPCTASIGVAMLGRDRTVSVDDYVRQADTAMYAAKAAGADLRLFDDELHSNTDIARKLRREMPAAIAKRQFVVHHQPIIRIRDRQVVALEALVRWPGPDSFLRPPECFIPVAEDDGQIVGLGRLVAELALTDLASYRHAHPASSVSLGINASPKELIRSDYASQLSLLVGEFGVEPGDVIVEVTESTMQQGGRIAEQNLRALRRIGVRTALDDFGTGFSSIGRLRAHDFDILKIDRSFIAGVADNRDDRAVVTAVIALATAFDVEVVAEGVETITQFQAVEELGCHGVQGWLFAPATPIGEVGPPDRFL